jgi:uncharacterized protein
MTHRDRCRHVASRCLIAPLLAATLLAPAVATAADGRRPVRTLLELRHDRVVLQEWDASCGAAALATILTYHFGDAITEEAVARQMLRRTDPLRVRHRGGFSLLDMKRFATERGFDADGYLNLSMDRLQALAPAIVPMHLDGYDHFVVFLGIRGQRARLADPAFGNREMPVDAFEQRWGRVAFSLARR